MRREAPPIDVKALHAKIGQQALELDFLANALGRGPRRVTCLNPSGHLSSFPHFDRNPNTGGNNYDETKGVVALNAVVHSAAYPSSITITVVKPSTSATEGGTHDSFTNSRKGRAKFLPWNS